MNAYKKGEYFTVFFFCGKRDFKTLKRFNFPLYKEKESFLINTIN